MCRTLLVENSKTFRRTFRDALRKRFPDMEIEEAADGVTAMQKVGTFHPDLIFMDIRLSGENGLALTEKIKTGLPGISVIVLTDYDLPEYRSAAFKNGADDFIAKGTLNMTHIGEIIHRLCPDS